VTATHNLTHHNLGSPAYCSPERVKNSQVDQNADLWALGVSLYEMVAGMPPYQAQNTRRLENLIQSRRPPRALPEACPGPLKAIIRKALAGEIERRYVSAAAFERDLQMFVQNRPTSAETEKVRAWDANATLDKGPARKTAPRQPKQKVASALSEFTKVVWAGIAGLAFGLLLFVPAGNAYRLFTQTAPLRGPHDFSTASVAQIEADWRLFESLKDKGGWLGKYSPVASARQSLRANLVSAGNEIVDRYRNGSDPAIANFDWAKARVCFEHALALDPKDNPLRARLALVDGYAQLLRDPASPAAQADFTNAITLDPKFGDPHLGLARICVYGSHNLGLAMVEFQAAERLGVRLSARETEQQADAFLYRAEQELAQWRTAPPAAQPHYLFLAQRDFDRARTMYEPIAGFDNAGQNLDRIENDENQQREIQTARAKAAQLAKTKAAKSRRVVRYRR